MPEFFTPPQLAKRWGCTPASILLLIQAGKLSAFTTSPPTSVKKRWKVTAAAVAAYEAGEAPAPSTAVSAPRRSSRKANRVSRFPMTIR
ncbi:hypothetical protein [Planctomyces sp. SH-PL14]|uniref:hypothetical protein n=1 Tax=Planctomyces sp. SH-PL14 TaxID=1632864 RepID=UPI0009465784|nr:hypothetical protein [Planctomyces sp. SH-PL14]